MLLDSELNIKFANRRLMEFQRYTPEIAHPGSQIAQVLRFQARRGDFGQAGDLDRMVEERLALIGRHPGALRAALGKRSISKSCSNSSTTAASSRSIATSPNCRRNPCRIASRRRHVVEHGSA